MIEMELHQNWYYPIPNMRTLILGTFPPHKKKWDYPFYYPNKANHFWKVLAALGKTHLMEWEGQPAIEERQLLMRKMCVGVQNIGLKIARKDQSASDSAITILEYQDLISIIDGHETLQKILLTGYSGKTSTYRSFITYLKNNGIGYTKPEAVKAGYQFIAHSKRSLTCIIGNSTSPTAQRAGVTFEMLVEQFRQAMSF
jgi:G:T/U-mismatch repair DNA glycosylase